MIRRLGRTSTVEPSPQGFTEQLWQTWQRDAARAVLLARWRWREIPEALVREAALVQQQVQAASWASQIDQQVTNQLGMMGIFPGFGGGGLTGGFGLDPGRAMFVGIMGMIRQHQGDPPASPELVACAEGVLRGQINPANALLAAAPPFARQQMQMALAAMDFMGGADLLRLQAVVSAASAVPRVRIPTLVPEAAA